MIQNIYTILFPVSCFGCKAQETALCNRCLTLARKNLAPLSAESISCFDYRDPLIKRCIQAIKYYRRKDLISPLTKETAAIVLTIPNISSYTLIPIPMPRFRKLLRGYNQAELIAYELHRTLGIPLLEKALSRNSTPKRQVKTKNKQERLENQKGSFSCNGNVQDMCILLVDDVTTTGATLQEARKVLLKHGAKKVLSVTLAH